MMFLSIQVEIEPHKIRIIDGWFCKTRSHQTFNLEINVGSFEPTCNGSAEPGHWPGQCPRADFRHDSRQAHRMRGAGSGSATVNWAAEFPDSPLDILAQQIVAMCACEGQRGR